MRTPVVRTRKITCDGVLLDGHKGAAVEVPFDPAVEWGTEPRSIAPGRKGHPVEVTLKGKPFRSVIVKRMRSHFVLVDEEAARRAKARIGDTVRVSVWPVREPLPSKARSPRTRR
jgi:hypothetical protein